MGLEGYLEDLGISEILQILSLSKKSGTLVLEDSGRQGSIVFLEGQVVRATSTQYPEGLGQLLQQQGLIDQAQLDSALAAQQGLSRHRPLGAILAESCGLERDEIEQQVERQIEKIVFSFFAWEKGTFCFTLSEPEAFGNATLNPFDFMLKRGISSQRLVVKGEHLLATTDGAAEPLDDAELEAEIRHLEQRLDDRELGLLRGMLAELENPYIGGGIILLILRYASEIMRRAIIFDVRGKQLVGLGQFGLTRLSTKADAIVRKLRLTAEPGSLFDRVLQQQCALIAPLGSSLSERTLQELLGGVPAQVFLAPLVSDGRVVAMLYGDNSPSQEPLSSTRPFEIFLSQAGMAMEQALQDG